MSAITAQLQAENALLKQKALFKELLASKNSLLAAKDSLLAVKDRELQRLRGDFSGDSKRARIAAGGDAFPLEKDEILDGVFSFVGLGEYFFAAGLSRRWKGRYIKLSQKQLLMSMTSSVLHTRVQ
jgi:hypothetical protein